MKTWMRRTLFGAGALLLVIQLVPYGRDHTNPPVTKEPAWDTPRTRELAERACFDCHSNATVWPWYSHVAPASWLVQRDVDEGRRHLNFSEFDRSQRHAPEAAEQVEEGEMPPSQFTIAHPEARLTDAERAELIRGLDATFAGGARPESQDDDGDRRRRKGR